MKKVIKFMLFLITLVIFSNKVHAADYSISLTTNHNGNLKPGDVIELNANIGSLAEDWSITKQDFLFIYDSDVFELITEKDKNGLSSVLYNVRDGWNKCGMSNLPGRFSSCVKASSDDYKILPKDASVYSSDDINATLVTIKLKVKNVDNQNTRVQLVNELDYVEQLDFTIYSKSINNFLSSLKVEGYELSENFNKNKTNYDVFVPYETEKVTVTATLEDSKATLIGIGEKQINVGDNEVELLVTAEDGAKKKYTVNIFRKAANEDVSLSKMIVTDSNKEEVILVYDEKNKIYTGNVKSDIMFVYFNIKCSGAGCYNEELEPTMLIEGKNEFKFNVVSQNGDEEIYQIIINKEPVKKDYTIIYLIISIGILLTTSIIFLILYLKSRKK